MGVPKFFRFLSERYPLLNQPVKLRGAPGIDNLFLDLNGVVHNASHGAGTDMNTRMTEARSRGDAAGARRRCRCQYRRRQAAHPLQLGAVRSCASAAGQRAAAGLLAVPNPSPPN